MKNMIISLVLVMIVIGIIIVAVADFVEGVEAYGLWEYLSKLGDKLLLISIPIAIVLGIWELFFRKVKRQWAIWIENLPYIRFLTAFGLILFISIIYWFSRLPQDSEIDTADFLSLLTNMFIGFATLAGLAFTAKQAGVVSDRIDAGRQQRFDENRRHGIELLTNESPSARSTGVRLFDDLAKKASQEDKKLILDLLYDYLKEKAKKQHQRDENGKLKQDDKGLIPEEPKPRDECVDIGLCIKVIWKHADETDKEAEKFLFWKLDLRNLDFDGADLRGANFMSSWLNDTRFVDADLREANLVATNLDGVVFGKTDLSSAYLLSAKLYLDNAVNEASFNTIIYEQGKEPKYDQGRRFPLPEERAYTWKGDRKRFVKSDENWSEKYVDECGYR